ncbi:protein phosphatase [Cystoisospora suis]|uniref:Protein phosphatase n=1 Tax=Cystoisospora suis TaxID=483139 RepID=A0A2C6KMW8_9APIC|nr:protein phosphatase [Cystoisospora suis]
MCCKKGFKPESPNQDDFFIIKVGQWSLYGVFDGHGPYGHDVSHYVQRELPAKLLLYTPSPPPTNTTTTEKGKQVSSSSIPSSSFLSSPLRALHQSFIMVHQELEAQTEEEKERQFYSSSSGGGARSLKRGEGDVSSRGGTKNGRGIDCCMSGTTATVILHVHAKKKLFIAHVGDSRAVLARRCFPKKVKKKGFPGEHQQREGEGDGTAAEGSTHGGRTSSAPVASSSTLPSSSASTRSSLSLGGGPGGGASKMMTVTMGEKYRDSFASNSRYSIPSQLIAIDLTNDHKPTNELERARIIKSGGQVRRLEGDVPHRVFLKNRLFPGLAMSRAIGDTIATQAGVIPDPELREYDIQEDVDEFILICSDGVWEFISSQEAIDIVSLYGRERVQDACEFLAREAWKRWIDEEHNVVDDITALIIYL